MKRTLYIGNWDLEAEDGFDDLHGYRDPQDRFGEHATCMFCGTVVPAHKSECIDCEEVDSYSQDDKIVKEEARFARHLDNTKES
jgi:hypothetical protein